MDYLWTPWRYQYIANINTRGSRCVFCIDGSPERDDQLFIPYRARLSFVILNIYPYTSGHLLISPFEHLSDLSDCSPELMSEMMLLAQKCKSVLSEVYHPDGFNLGMNLGRCAGAGVEHHLHLHVVPRWIGDSNFMTVVGESRVLPDDLPATFAKLRPFFLD
jgi:ATP adenylyltransferase